MTILKRLIPFKIKNIWFIINHLGLWLVIIGSSLGAGDFIKLKMTAVKNQTVKHAIDNKNNIVESDIAIELKSFNIEYFAPELQLWDIKKNKPVNNVKPVQLSNKSKEIILGGYKVYVYKYFPNAFLINNQFQQFDYPGSVPSALISVINNSDTLSGWINAPNEIHNMGYIKLNNEQAIILQTPKPLKYSSEVKIYTKSGLQIKSTIEVNKPLTIDGWKIYQVGYNAYQSKWSEISIFEIIKDPWLPVVYSGMFLMIIGSVWFFFRGVNLNIEKT